VTGVTSRFESRPRPGLGLLLLAGCMVSIPGGAEAQSWAVEIGAGQSVHDAAQATTTGAGLTLGVRREAPTWFFLSAGIPIEPESGPWGALGLGGRWQASAEKVGYGIDLGGQGFAFQDPLLEQGGGGITAEAMPLVSLRHDRIALQLRSGAAHHTSSFAGTSVGRTAHQTDGRVDVSAGWLTVSGGGRLLRSGEGSFPYLGGSAEAHLDRLTLSAYGGSWMHEALPGADWGAGARLHITDGTSGYVAIHSGATDPLFWNAPFRGWSLGVTQRVGRSARSPLPLPIVRREAGTVTIQLPLSASASPPSVAGDFNGWQPVPMVRSGDDWIVHLPLRPGVYRYAFRSAEGDWFVPEGTPGREPDGFGGFNAILVVR
jgi:hypothetical protein